MSENENIRALIEATVTKLIAELVPAVRTLVVAELAAALQSAGLAGVPAAQPPRRPRGSIAEPSPVLYAAPQEVPPPDVATEPSVSATGTPEASETTPAGAGPGRCSRCGTRGHNARTCNRNDWSAEPARPRIGPGAGAPAAVTPVDTSRAQRFAEIERAAAARKAAR